MVCHVVDLGSPCRRCHKAADVANVATWAVSRRVGVGQMILEHGYRGEGLGAKGAAKWALLRMFADSVFHKVVLAEETPQAEPAFKWTNARVAQLVTAHVGELGEAHEADIAFIGAVISFLSRTWGLTSSASASIHVDLHAALHVTLHVPLCITQGECGVTFERNNALHLHLRATHSDKLQLPANNSEFEAANATYHSYGNEKLQ